MRNFARIVSLGDVDCNVHRRGQTELEFDFWMEEEGRVFSPSITISYQASWFLDMLFDGTREEDIKEECEKALAEINRLVAVHEELFVGGEDIAFTLDERSLAMLQPDAADSPTDHL